ncbi:putative regulatory subunit of protein kinase a-like protein [Trypanosoma theileri]|uniref:Putative regulatory subunit of protein kinase a-like protein n=1 Tax=Trypanosoma theileri TaxID=67003 RepID=A0A1X0PA25_9TRYP|nr:putative regulatory subunit of protein kinase a-like protein [Trypanosoma theileri]ORC93681.1 putative regulatory subunit of protein kinase a-like protein [Trypanosoma theileri]
MSKFDKSVCEWIASSSINRASKQEILERVKSTIDEYKKLDERSHHYSNTVNDDNEKNKSTNNRNSRKSATQTPPLGKKSTLRSSKKNEEGKMVDYGFTEVVDDVLHKLERESMPPLPPRRPSTKMNESQNEIHSVNSAPQGNEEPKNTQDIISESQQEHHEENVSCLSDDQPHSEKNRSVSSDLEAMQNRFATFKFGKAETESQPSAVVETNHFEDAAAARRNSEDEIIAEGEDARLRLLQQKRSSRPGISALSIDADEIMSTEFLATPKSSEDMAFIKKVLESHFLFSFLDDAEISMLTMVMDTTDIPEGTKIISRDETGDTFYIVLSGEAKMTMYEKEEEEEEEERTKTIDLQRGAVFGDLQLLYEVKSEVTVEAMTPMVCATIKRKTYKIILSRSAEEKRKRYVSFLEKVPFLKDLTPDERSKMAEALKNDHFTQGDKIIRYGEKGDWLHIIVEGTADVIGRNEAGEEEYVATFHEGDCAGDLEFLFHHETVADIVVSSPTVKTAKLSRRHFEKLIGTAKELLQRKAEEDASYQYYRRTMGSASPPREDLAPPFDQPPEYVTKSKLHLEY